MRLLEMLGYKFDLNMDESESVEINKIEEALRLARVLLPPRSVDKHMESLRGRRQLTLDAYRMKKEAIAALEVALSSNDYQVAWENAHCIAQTHDKAVQMLSTDKLRDIIAPKKCLKTAFLLKSISLCVDLATICVCLFTFRMYDQEESISFLNNVMYLVLMNEIIALLIFVFEMQFPLLTKLFTKLYVPHSATNAVLCAAASVGVELNQKHLFHITAGEIIKDSSSLISLLINIENNSNKLKHIKALDLPDAYTCPITTEIITDPVYSDHNPKRFERTALLVWLQKRNTHPCTNLPLFAEDLKRDFKLKREIDLFAESKSKINSEERTHSTLIGLSVFKPQSQCFEVDCTDDDIITDKMMAESAFGQSCKTNKYKRP